MILKILRYLIVGVIAIVLVSVGIDAADNYDNLSESLVGRLVFGKSSGPCPQDMVFVPSEHGNFCIDKYEASAGDSCPYQSPETQKETRVNLDQIDCRPVSIAGNLPWRNISQDQASRACAKAGKRLATNAEWLQASQGTPDHDSPWGASDCQVSANWDNQPGVTGSGENCVSSFGAYDMVGNVWEWVKGVSNDGVFDGEELPESGYIYATNGEGIPTITKTEQADDNYNSDFFWLKKKGSRGMVRGGYWNNKSKAGVYSLYAVTPSFSVEPGIGFRCVK